MTDRAVTTPPRHSAAFIHDERGATAILFAVMLVPLLCISFLAIDYGRANGVRTSLQSAADAAVRAAALRLGGPREDVDAAVGLSLAANLQGPLKTLPYQLVIAQDEQSLSLKIDKKVELSLAGLMGIGSLDASVESSARRPQPERPAAGDAGDHNSDDGAEPAGRGSGQAGLPAGVTRSEIDEALARAGAAQGASAEQIRATQQMARQMMRELESMDAGEIERLRSLMGR